MTTAGTRPRPMFDWMFALALVGVIAATVRILAFTPYEATQGPAQKI